MDKPFRPMLAGTCKDVESLSYPVAVSPKLDGIRCTIVNGVPQTRSGKPIPNHFIRNTLTNPLLDGLDGELIIGKPTDPDVYRTTNSAVMSLDGTPTFSFHVFDNFLSEGS